MRIDIDELEIWYMDGGGIPTFKYQNFPFTGTAIQYYDNGSILDETDYVDGYQEGWVRSFHENGQLYIEQKKYNNITIDGTYKEFDQDGILILEL